jgi:hypothetical protein
VISFTRDRSSPDRHSPELSAAGLAARSAFALLFWRTELAVAVQRGGERGQRAKEGEHGGSIRDENM